MEIQPDLDGNTNEVWCLDFSHDGKNIVSGEGYDHRKSDLQDTNIKI